VSGVAPVLGSEIARPDLVPVLEHRSPEKLYHLDLVADGGLGRCLVVPGKSLRRCCWPLVRCLALASADSRTCIQAVASVEVVGPAAGCSRAEPERSADRIEKR